LDDENIDPALLAQAAQASCGISRQPEMRPPRPRCLSGAHRADARVRSGNDGAEQRATAALGTACSGGDRQVNTTRPSSSAGESPSCTLHCSSSALDRTVTAKRQMLRQLERSGARDNATDNSRVHNASTNLVNIATAKTTQLTAVQKLARRQILVSMP